MDGLGIRSECHF